MRFAPLLILATSICAFAQDSIVFNLGSQFVTIYRDGHAKRIPALSGATSDKFLTNNGTSYAWQTIEGGGDMLKSENLSGLGNYTTARTNLGLGSLATQSGTFSGTSSGTNTGDNSANSIYTNDYRAANFIAGSDYLAPNGSAATLTSFPTLNQSTTGNAGTATALLTPRTIGGTSFDGTANITVATATGGFTVSGGNLALGTNSLTLTGSIASTGSRITKGWFTDLESTNAITGSVTGNAGTATVLQTSRNINGTAFNGSADITVTAAAGTLTGTVLNSSVVTSSLTSVGTITSGTWNGTDVAIADGGTGQGTATAAFNALAPSKTSNALKYLRVNAGATDYELVTLAGGGDALKTDPLSQFATTTSSQFMGVISDETGSGVIVGSASPALTGTPTSPTAALNTNSTQIATTAYVDTKVRTLALTTNATANSTTSMVEVANMNITVGTGTYVFEYYVVATTSVTTTSLKFAVNHTGTTTLFLYDLFFPSAGVTAATGVVDQEQNVTTGSVWAYESTRIKNTTLGPTTDTDATTSILYRISGTMIVTVSGDLELYHGSETNNSTQVMGGTSLILTKVAD